MPVTPTAVIKKSASTTSSAPRQSAVKKETPVPASEEVVRYIRELLDVKDFSRERAKTVGIALERYQFVQNAYKKFAGWSRSIGGYVFPEGM